MLVPTFSVIKSGACIDFCEECVGCGSWLWYLAVAVALFEIL
jgi:hypothetical protein